MPSEDHLRGVSSFHIDHVDAAAREFSTSPCAAHPRTSPSEKLNSSTFKPVGEDANYYTCLSRSISSSPGTFPNSIALALLDASGSCSERCFQDCFTEKLTECSNVTRINEEHGIGTLTAWVPLIHTSVAGRPICILAERTVQKRAAYGHFMLSKFSSGSQTRKSLLRNVQKLRSSNAPDERKEELNSYRDEVFLSKDYSEINITPRCTLRPSWRLQSHAVGIRGNSFFYIDTI